MRELATHDLFYEPATAYGYGRLGYMSAARVAEIVTGKPFEQVMADELFAVLGSPLEPKKVEDLSTPLLRN